MIYKLTSAREILAKVENDFDLDYSDWLTRAPIWISNALDRLQLVSAYETKIHPAVLEDYHCDLPGDAVSDVRTILGVEYDNTWLKRISIVAPKRMITYDTKDLSRDTYTIKNGYITSSLEEGSINIYYETPAVEYDEVRNIYLPKVPDNSIAQDAIGWWIMYSILKRGHKHPVYSLDSRNPITNPYSMWLIESKMARNSCGVMDRETRENFSIMYRTFLINLESPTHKD